MGQAIKVGDVVRLKSGGPKMTVQDIKIEGIDTKAVTCIWFDTSFNVVKEDIEPSLLQVQVKSKT